MIRIALVDDHLIVRQSLKMYLQFIQDFKVVLDVGTVSEFREFYSPDQIDIVILDIRLKGESGLDLCNEMFKNYPNIKIIMFSAYLEESIIIESIKCGARGFVNKSDSSSQLEKTIREVMLNGHYYSADLGTMLRNELLKTHKRKIINDTFRVEFTKTELEIAIAHGNQCSNKDIAEKLKLSVRSVESYKKNMCDKTYSVNFTGVLVYMFKYFVIFPQDLESDVALKY